MDLSPLVVDTDGRWLLAPSGDTDAAVDAPQVVRLAPPDESDNDGSSSSSTCSPCSAATLQRTLSTQSARDIEMIARCDAERSLDTERREQEQLDRSIESVLSEQDETASALREQLSSAANDMFVSLPRSASGEYVPASWWVGDRGTAS